MISQFLNLPATILIPLICLMVSCSCGSNKNYSEKNEGNVENELPSMNSKVNKLMDSSLKEYDALIKEYEKLDQTQVDSIQRIISDHRDSINQIFIVEAENFSNQDEYINWINSFDIDLIRKKKAIVDSLFNR